MSDFILQLHPMLGFTLGIVLCHGGMYGIAYFVEGRVLVWTKQYYAFVYGNIVLAVAVGSGLWINQKIGLPGDDHWSQRWWLHLLAAIIVIAIAVLRWAVNDYANYSVGQSASPTKLYHDTLFITDGYLVYLTTMPLLTETWWCLVPIGLLGFWAFLGVLDGKHPEKAQYAHVDHDWWPKYFVLKHIEPILGRKRNVPA